MGLWLPHPFFIAMRKTLITSPTSEPVTLIDVKSFARIDCNEDDFLISSLITQAREYAENYTHRKFGSQVWEMTLDAVDITKCVKLEEYDVQLVSSITVYDKDNVSTVVPVSEYDLYTNRILFDLGTYDLRSLDSMVINYTVGGNIVPDAIKLAIMQMVATFYENRESVINGTISSMIDASAIVNMAGHTIYSV